MASNRTLRIHADLSSSSKSRDQDRVKRQGMLALAFAFFCLLISNQIVAASEAAIVVRHGDGSITYAVVVFPEDEISSFELLSRSTISLTTVAFGGLGEAVCTLDGEGCGLSDCRVRLCQTGDPDSSFWQFFRQDSSGVWISQPLGASASNVRDGDVDGWSWTAHDPGMQTSTVALISSLLKVDPAEVAAVPGGESQAFTASFDASGNRIEPRGSSSASSWSTAAGIAALVVLAVIGLVLKRNRAHRQASR
ncbi:MAG: hypothetical protein ACRDHN_02015 [Thermomicrobiales bacterium]